MCIFSGPVDQVSKTKIAIIKIFGSEKKIINKKKFRMKVGRPMQMTIYENKVSIDSNGTGHAMILPFPLIKGVNRFKLVDLSNYDNVMNDIDELFPVSKSTLSNAASYNSTDSIPVTTLGSYKVSVVPSLEDFSKVQLGEFNLTKDVAELLSQYYSKNFGFVVCILQESADFHPIAYIHEYDEVFIPTRHHHSTEIYDPQIDHDIDTIFNNKHIDIEEVNDSPLGEIVHDVYASQQIKRTGLKRNMANLGIKRKDDLHDDIVNVHNDWDHNIYILGFDVSSLKNFVNSPGVEYLIAQNFNLQNIKNRIDFSKFPKFIFIGDIFTAVKIMVNKLYTGNHDLFLRQSH